MPLTHSTANQNAQTDAAVDRLDNGSANAAGTLRLRDSTTTIVDCLMSNPAFGASASGVATANSINDGTAEATGTVDNFQLLDRDETLEISGVVGLKRAVGGVSTGAGGTFTITGADHTTEFAAGTDFTIVGSTGNDGMYEVGSVEYTGGNTVITVEADYTISDATVDGYIHIGQVGLDNTSVTSGQTVSASSMTYRAQPQ